MTPQLYTSAGAEPGVGEGQGRKLCWEKLHQSQQTQLSMLRLWRGNQWTAPAPQTLEAQDKTEGEAQACHNGNSTEAGAPGVLEERSSMVTHNASENVPKPTAPAWQIVGRRQALLCAGRWVCAAGRDKRPKAILGEEIKGKL